MLFEFYEQQDLYQIAGCARQSTLENWLHAQRIPFGYNAKGKVLVHQGALANALGAPSASVPPDTSRDVVLNLEV